MNLDPIEIEHKVDRAVTAALPISQSTGGILFEKMGELTEFAKLMAAGGEAVPYHCRGKPGVCLAILNRAFRWKMDPYAVAEQTYIPPKSDRLAYMSQLVHAVIEAHAPLKGRLRHRIIGTGDERRCEVSGTFIGETEPHVYTSETLASLRDARGRNEYGTLKGSPLWDTQPEVQLFYSASRQWARMYSPETLLGIYTPEEIADIPRDVTPARYERPVNEFEERLKLAKAERMAGESQSHGRGFDASYIDREVSAATGGGSKTIEGEVSSSNAEQSAEERTDNEGRFERDDEHERGQDDTANSGAGDDAGGSTSTDRDVAGDGEGSPGEGEARAQEDEGIGGELAPENDPLGGAEDSRVTRKGGTRKPAGRK